MKATDLFKKTINDYILSRGNIDINKHPDKSIDNCVNYILTQVEKSGCNGFTDDEIYSLAVHYYDEPNESLGDIKDLCPRCVVNHVVELSDEERENARKEAFEKLVNEEKSRMTSKSAKQQKPQETKMKQTELTLF